MTLRGSRRPRLAVVAALAFSLSLPHGIAVLCVGSDGRVALELAAPAIAGARVDDGTRELSSDVRSCPCGDDCGPCTDTPLGVGNVFLRLQRGSQVPSLLAAAMTTCDVPVVVAPRPIAEATPAGARARAVPSTGHHPRTTVLLI